METILKTDGKETRRLKSEVNAWRSTWERLCSRLYSQSDERTNLAIVYPHGVVKAGQGSVLDLNLMFSATLPSSVTLGTCGPCEYDSSPILNGECLVCGSPTEEGSQ